MAPLVTVVIVAYRSADDLVELLPLLDDPRVEVIVLDNASPDDGLEVVARHPWCVSVPMGWNAGWTAACNEGARRALAPVLAFVNPDVRVRAADLLELSTHLGPGVASVSPAFINLRGEQVRFAFRFPDPLTGLMVFFNAGRRLDRRLGSRFVHRRTYASPAGHPSDVDHVGAACLVVDAETFKATEGFDERMWLFFSDTDWALRARQLGLRSLVAHDVEVVHEGGGSVGHLLPDTLATLFLRDYVRYADKHFSKIGKVVTRVGVVALVGLLPALAGLGRRDYAAARRCLAQVREVLR